VTLELWQTGTREQAVAFDLVAMEAEEEVVAAAPDAAKHLDMDPAHTWASHDMGRHQAHHPYMMTHRMGRHQAHQYLALDFRALLERKWDDPAASL
jgi:fatty acid desaturase